MREEAMAIGLAWGIIAIVRRRVFIVVVETSGITAIVRRGIQALPKSKPG